MKRSIVTFKSNRQEECVQMLVKIATPAARPSFGLPELLVAIHTSRQSCSKAGKARIFALIGSHPWNPDLIRARWLWGRKGR